MELNDEQLRGSLGSQFEGWERDLPVGGWDRLAADLQGGQSTKPRAAWWRNRNLLLLLPLVGLFFGGGYLWLNNGEKPADQDQIASKIVYKQEPLSTQAGQPDQTEEPDYQPEVNQHIAASPQPANSIVGTDAETPAESPAIVSAKQPAVLETPKGSEFKTPHSIPPANKATDKDLKAEKPNQHTRVRGARLLPMIAAKPPVKSDNESSIQEAGTSTTVTSSRLGNNHANNPEAVSKGSDLVGSSTTSLERMPITKRSRQNPRMTHDQQTVTNKPLSKETEVITAAVKVDKQQAEVEQSVSSEANQADHAASQPETIKPTEAPAQSVASVKTEVEKQQAKQDTSSQQVHALSPQEVAATEAHVITNKTSYGFYGGGYNLRQDLTISPNNQQEVIGATSATAIEKMAFNLGFTAKRALTDRLKLRFDLGSFFSTNKLSLNLYEGQVNGYTYQNGNYASQLQVNQLEISQQRLQTEMGLSLEFYPFKGMPFYLHGGVAAWYQVWKQDRVASNGVILAADETKTRFGSAESQPLNGNFSVGFGWKLPITKNTSLLIEPAYKQAFRPITFGERLISGHQQYVGLGFRYLW